MRTFYSLIVIIGLACMSAFAQSEAEGIPETFTGYKKIGKIKTRTTHEIESSAWSVGGETMDRDYTVYKYWSPYLEELGVKKVRLQGGWAKCEKERGVYSWDWLDEVIFDLPKKSIEPWVCLCYGNPLYGRGETKLGSKIDTDEISLAAWLKWVEKMVNRYKSVVNEWEIWNEPNGHNPPEEYAKLLIPTAELIKKIQPEAQIIGFALAGTDLKFAESVLKILKDGNKTGLIDFLCYHPYSFNPDDSYEKVDQLYKLMKSYAPEMELRQGENGAPSEYRNTKALRQYEWSELTQAKWALRRMLGDLGRDIPTSIFSIIDMKYPDEMNRKGLLFSNEDQTVGHRKQAYFAVQNLASLFDNSLKRIKDFSYETNCIQKNSAFAFQKLTDESDILVIWLHTNRPVDYNSTTPVDVKFKGIKFRNPVLVDIRTGVVFEIHVDSYDQKDSFFGIRNLPVYDSPVAVAEKSMIKILEGSPE